MIGLASFLSGGFITAIVVNPPERKLAKRTSVHYILFRTLMSDKEKIECQKYCLLTQVKTYFTVSNTHKGHLFIFCES